MEEVLFKVQHLNEHKDFEILINQIITDYKGIVANSNMDLKSLKSIILTEDIYKSIEDFNHEYGTQIKGSVDVAGKVLYSTNKEDIRIVIRLDNCLLKSLDIKNQIVIRILYIRRLVHELAHIDNGNKLKIQSMPLSGVDLVLKQIAFTIWDEYYANRKAMSTLIKIIKGENASTLMIEFIKSDINGSEEMFRKLKECEDAGVFENVVQALRNVAYMKGSLHGAGILKRIGLEDTIYSYLEDPNILDVFSIELDRIYNLNFGWNDMKEFDQLSFVIGNLICELRCKDALISYAIQQDSEQCK